MARKKYPIEHWSYSSLVSYLRNPLAWHKRYVEGVYDIPSTPAGVVGRAAHVALQHFYSGLGKEAAIALGLEYLQDIPDFEINFGTAQSIRARKKKRAAMEREYSQAIWFYLARPPRHRVLGVEVKALARVPGIALPVKAVSDLVVESRVDGEAVDIIDHKFVNTFGKTDLLVRGRTPARAGTRADGQTGTDNPLFMVQALFNYYTVLSEFKRPVRRFIVYECKKTKNKNRASQLRRHYIDFQKHKEEFKLFHRLLADATEDLRTRKMFLPNPSDMFEGKDSLEIYRFGLVDR